MWAPFSLPSFTALLPGFSVGGENGCERVGSVSGGCARFLGDVVSTTMRFDAGARGRDGHLKWGGGILEEAVLFFFVVSHESRGRTFVVVFRKGGMMRISSGCGFGCIFFMLRLPAGSVFA